MGVYNQLPVAVQEPIELLCLEDEIVASAFWNRRQPLVEPAMMEIIQAWKDKTISSTEALKRLDLQDMLDPNELMLGFAAVQGAK